MMLNICGTGLGIRNEKVEQVWKLIDWLKILGQPLPRGLGLKPTQ